MTTFDFHHFLTAQNPVYTTALDELRAGQKTSHWIWFIFPQLRGLGRSPTALKYGLRDLAEAQAYLAHPILGARLIECTEALLNVQNRRLREILGSPDDLKFRSSMTLFSKVPGASDIFRRALDQFCRGKDDPLTIKLIRSKPR